MFAVKLLANLVVACNCYVALNMFEYVFTFHISHTIWGIMFNWSLLNAVNVLTSYVKLCSVYVQLKRANQSCSPSKISC